MSLGLPRLHTERLVIDAQQPDGSLTVRLGRDSGDTVVGRLIVRPVGHGTHAVELDGELASDRRGHGYANEATQAVVDALFAKPAVQRVAVAIAADNDAGLRLFERLGFHREGVARAARPAAPGGATSFVDEVLFGLTRGEWSRPPGLFDVVAFDADDTLWTSEDSFDAAERAFVDLLASFAGDGVDVKAALTAVERKNLHVFGYGVRAFGLSMVETAITLAGDEALPGWVIAQLIETTRSMLLEPVHLLADVASVLERVGAGRRLVLITKGDLIHQTAKIESSGLAHHFERIEIVLEKDADTYRRIMTELGVSPQRFLMVGNSVRSDILPVLALGANAVHVPYHLLWDLEQAPHDHGHVFAELSSLSELPAWLDQATGAAEATTESTTARDV